MAEAAEVHEGEEEEPEPEEEEDLLVEEVDGQDALHRVPAANTTTSA